MQETLGLNVLCLPDPPLILKFKFLTTAFDEGQKSRRKYRAPKGDRGDIKAGLRSPQCSLES